MLDRLLALLQLVGLAFLELLELGLGELQEGLVVRRERVCRERLQRGRASSASSSVLTRLAYWARTTSQVAAAPTRRPMTSPTIIGAQNPRDSRRTDHENAGPDEPESPSEPARRAYVAAALRGQAEKARSLRTFARDGRASGSRARRSSACSVCCRLRLGGRWRPGLAARWGRRKSSACRDVSGLASPSTCARDRLRRRAVGVRLPLGHLEAVHAGRDVRHHLRRSASRCPRSPWLS